MRPAALLLLAVLASRAGAESPQTPEDDLRDALAHAPIDLDFEGPLADAVVILHDTLQFSLLVDPKSDGAGKSIRVSGKALEPAEALRRVREAAGLVEVNSSGILIWTTEKRAAEFRKHRKPALPAQATERDRALWKTLQERPLDLDFTDSRPEDLVDFLREYLRVEIVARTGREKNFSFCVRNTTALETIDLVAFFWDSEVRVTDGTLLIELPNWVQPPDGLKSRFENGRLRLDWNGPAEGEYVVRRLTDAGEEQVARTRERFAEIDGLPVHRELDFSVTRVAAGGFASVPLEAKVGTWPPEYVRGESMMPEWWTLAFDFALRQNVWDDRTGCAGPFDFSINIAEWSNGAETIHLTTVRGAAPGIPGAFGDFDRAEARAFRHSAPAAEIDLVPPASGPLFFRLITRDGGHAQVRIERHHETAWIRYVYLPPRTPPAIADVIDDLTGRAPEAAAADTSRLSEAAARLGDADAAARDAAQKTLREAGLKAVRVLSKVATEGSDPEARARATEILQAIWVDED